MHPLWWVFLPFEIGAIAGINMGAPYLGLEGWSTMLILSLVMPIAALQYRFSRAIGYRLPAVARWKDFHQFTAALAAYILIPLGLPLLILMLPGPNPVSLFQSIGSLWLIGTIFFGYSLGINLWVRLRQQLMK